MRSLNIPEIQGISVLNYRSVKFLSVGRCRTRSTSDTIFRLVSLVLGALDEITQKRPLRALRGWTAEKNMATHLAETYESISDAIHWTNDQIKS